MANVRTPPTDWKSIVAEVRRWTSIVMDHDENGVLWRVRRVSKPGCPEWVKDYAEGR